MAHPLINAQSVRVLALKLAREERPTVGFDRVSDSFLTQAENQLRTWMRGYISRLPSTGKTIK